MHRTDLTSNLASLPALAALPRRELRAIGRHLTAVDVGAGRRLVEEGRRGREFMVIASGRAAVHRDAVELALLEDGDFFGELALLTGRPRTASVTTLTPMRVLVLSHHDLLAALDASPTFAQRVCTRAIQRLATLAA